MTSKTIWRPRITVDVPGDLYDRMQNALPWGTRNAILTEIFNQLTAAIERGGPVVAYLVLNRKLPMFRATSTDVEGVLEDGP